MGYATILLEKADGLVHFSRPTIAMVDGFAVGAGCNLALCCDLIIASDRAKFGEVFARIGLVPDGAGTYFLPRTMGLAAFFEKRLPRFRGD